jgi:hypothetical protein
VHRIRRFWLLLKKKLGVFAKIESITDIRKNPVIKLYTIIMSILLMPFYNLKSLLAFDSFARKKSFKRLFDCKRKMVASDSTINRALRWMNPCEIIEF